MPFSQQHADAAANFFELILRHTADEWYGTPFLLAPWQEEALTAIFGQLDDNGNRCVQLSYVEVPKKAGKTEWAAGIALLALMLDPNPGCQVYGAAAAVRQALNVYTAACKMVEQSPILKRRLRLLRSTHRIIKRSDPDSFYAAVAADGDLSDGVNPSVVIADEVHRWRTRKQLENWDVLSLGGITRKQTLTIAITTAGVQNESPLAWRLHEKTKRIQEGVASDPTFFGRIYAADESDDWTAESTWIKANPSLIENGGFLPIAKIRERFSASLSDPEAQRAFKRYYLNLWGQKEQRAVDMARWDLCPNGGSFEVVTADESGAEVRKTIQLAPSWKAVGLLPKSPDQRVRTFPHDFLKLFFGRRCWAGVDLSMTTDMSAVTFVFPGEAGGYDLLPFFWIPEADLRKRELRDGMPYETWSRQGFLELSKAHNGTFIDEQEVESRLRWGAEMFDLQEICFDPWNSRGISGRLVNDGYQCIEIRQGYATLSEPSKKFLELAVSGRLRHGGHPVLRWNALCLSTKEANDNLMFTKPERAKSTLRIDGISAAVNALQRAMLDNAAVPSVSLL